MTRKVCSWLAIAAMALQALWPLIAQARPVTLVPVCTVGGETHYIELPAGETSSHEHCSFCIAGAALPPHVVRVVDAPSSAATSGCSFQAITFSFVEADARAPPVLQWAIHNHYWRNDEEAFALRVARSDLGGGVVRFRVLLD